MLFSFLHKQRDIKKQKRIIETMISSLNISPEQKDLYFQAIKIMNQQECENLYKNLIHFIEKVELKEIEQIRKESFGNISGMRKKEIEEKAQEMNSFSFLLNNL